MLALGDVGTAAWITSSRRSGSSKMVSLAREAARQTDIKMAASAHSGFPTAAWRQHVLPSGSQAARQAVTA
eukprot:4828611-Prorocentrum_lima.AAC.1